MRFAGCARGAIQFGAKHAVLSSPQMHFPLRRRRRRRPANWRRSDANCDSIDLRRFRARAFVQVAAANQLNGQLL